MSRPNTARNRSEPRKSPSLYQVVGMTGVLVVGAILFGSLVEARARFSAEIRLVESGRELFRAMEGYRAAKGAYPSNGDPLIETFDTSTLEPLVKEGMLKDVEGLTRDWQEERVEVYCSPDMPTRNADFWAVLVSGDSKDVKVLVADTDQYPGREGERLRGVYLLRAGHWVSRGS